MKNKEKILDIISSNNCWVSANDILVRLENSIDKTTVYRNITKLLDDNSIIEDFSNSWEKIYSSKDKHHHHFVCNICWSKENIWCFMSPEIEKLEKIFWFKVMNHSFILSWECNNCK